MIIWTQKQQPFQLPRVKKTISMGLEKISSGHDKPYNTTCCLKMNNLKYSFVRNNQRYNMPYDSKLSHSGQWL